MPFEHIGLLIVIVLLFFRKSIYGPGVMYIALKKICYFPSTLKLFIILVHTKDIDIVTIKSMHPIKDSIVSRFYGLHDNIL